MALDALRNWTVAMEENLLSLRPPRRRKSSEDSIPTITSATTATAPASRNRGPPVHLPTELILLILDYVPRKPSSQRTLWSLCLLNRQWYSTCIARLYEHPLLEGANYDAFVRTICPSINAHVRRSPLADLVHFLDLGKLVHQGSKSVTARLLGRTKANLEFFRAPQASFAVNCCAALSKCTKLRTLDLSLVSESPTFHSLSHVLRSLPSLESFAFPRSSLHASDDFAAQEFQWPPKLRQLIVTGGIGDWFMFGMARNRESLPPSLEELVLEHCPHITVHSFMALLGALAQQLTRLSVSNMPALNPSSLDGLLAQCPKLTHLSVSLDYISMGFTVLEQLLKKNPDMPIPHPLRYLELTTSGHPRIDEDMLRPMDIEMGIEEGLLSQLRIVRVDSSLQWAVGELQEEATELEQMMQVIAAKAREPARELQRVGVWTF